MKNHQNFTLFRKAQFQESHFNCHLSRLASTRNLNLKKIKLFFFLIKSILLGADDKIFQTLFKTKTDV